VLREYLDLREKVAGGWRRLHNEELHKLYVSPNIIRVIKLRRMRLAGNVARMETTKNAYKTFVGEPEGKRALGISRHRWEDNIRMVLREIGWEAAEWMNLAQDRDQCSR
jgi:hypothetical protein